jgi:hypothetical protein
MSCEIPFLIMAISLRGEGFMEVKHVELRLK